MKPIEAAESELWGDDAKIAERITVWFDLLVKIRKAAGANVDPAALVEQIKRIDPAQLEGAQVWLTTFLWDRFELSREGIAKRKQMSLNAMNRACPYTREQYDKAVAENGTKQQVLAQVLGVDRRTLRKYGRPPI